MNSKPVLKAKLVLFLLLLLMNGFAFCQNKKQSNDAIKELLAVEGFKKVITKALGADAPLELDQKKSFEQYTGAVNNFSPVMLKSTSDLDRPLSPGDYSVDVIFYCTQWSIHRPGAGLPYKLGRAQGRLAKQMTALLFKGTLKHINPGTLNAMAWRIQGGVQLQKWPVAEQKLIHELIPEYEKDLKGDYVQQFEDYYGKLVAPITKKNFDTQLASLGEIGKKVMDLRKSRQILVDNNIAQDKLPERLYDQNKDGTPLQLPPTKDKPSPWMTVLPNVIARFTVQQGNLGRNLLEFRVLQDIEPNIKRSKGGGFSNNERLAEENSDEITLTKLFNGSGKDEGKGMVAYPVLAGAQIPNIQPILNENEENEINKAVLEAIALLNKKYMLIDKWDALTQQDVKTWMGEANAVTREMLMLRISMMTDALKGLKPSNFKKDISENHYAYVYPNDKSHTIYLESKFFSAPLTGENSKAGTIIHEVSHFCDVACTKDYQTYGTLNSKQLANTYPEDAQTHADSFEFLIEH